MPAAPLAAAAAQPVDGLRPDVVVIGAGLAGSLLALVLVERGLAVSVIAPASADLSTGEDLPATTLSYGAMAGERAAADWRRLERRHGPLGWRPSRLVAHGEAWPLARLPPDVLALAACWFPLSRVDGSVLAAALPAALSRAGVRRQHARVTALSPRAGGGWQLSLHADGAAAGPLSDQLTAPQVVLAAGSGCRALWPGLSPRLRSSWAGVLLAPLTGSSAWLEQVRRGRVVMPRRWQLPALEQAGGGRPAQGLPDATGGERWVVDPGLTPRGEGLVLGQISLLRPGGDPGAPPDPDWMESHLRQGLSRLDPQLARLSARYRQVAVPFCTDNRPLVGPVAGATGLWVFTGFSGAFSQVPPAATDLAAAIGARLNPCTA